MGPSCPIEEAMDNLLKPLSEFSVKQDSICDQSGSSLCFPLSAMLPH